MTRATRARSLLLAALWIAAPLPVSAQVFAGVNLAGAEFGETALPGSYGTDYTYPTPAEIFYYLEQGMNAFRIPFRWERLQPAPGGPLAAEELDRLHAIVGFATRRGAHVVLDPHNYARYYGWEDDWYGEPNASAMLGVVDPIDQFAFEVHQYLDGNSSGTSPAIVSPTIGSERLVEFTAWLREHGYRGWLGEFAVARETIGDAPGQIGDEALADMLDYVETNGDVWLGWTWWAGGPWWGSYMFALDPLALGEPDEQDRPQMAVLEPYLLPEPSGGLAAGIAAVAALAIVRRPWRSSSTR